MKILTIIITLFLTFSVFAKDLTKKEIKELIIKSKVDSTGETESKISAQYYWGGKHIKKDFQKALFWAERSANKGYFKAQIYLAYSYCNIIKDKNKNFKKGSYWLKKAMTKNRPEIRQLYSTILDNGLCGFKKDTKKAIDVLLPYAKKGSLADAYFLALLYGDKANPYRDEINKEAIKWNNYVIKKGHPAGFIIL